VGNTHLLVLQVLPHGRESATISFESGDREQIWKLARKVGIKLDQRSSGEIVQITKLDPPREEKQKRK
jgi:hypothetical protein